MVGFLSLCSPFEIQRAYAALAVADAGDYKRVKAAILRRYDITDDSYRRRFRAARAGLTTEG